jgi:hypothetical protein
MKPKSELSESLRRAFEMTKNLLFSSLLLAISSSSLAAQQLSIATPEDLAGRWETSDGHGGMVGMHVIVSTHVEGAPVSLIRHKQYLDDLDIGLYQRTGADVGEFDFSFFSTSADGGVVWDGQQLRMLAPQRGDQPKVEISLSWDETKKQWDGHYEHGEFSRTVTLKRPENEHVSSLVGTWFESKGMMNNCVHIAQQADGVFTAWFDDILIPGRMRYANGIQPPQQSREHYGEIAKVNIAPSGEMTVELRAYTAMCCSHPFVARISPDGSKLIGSWSSAPNQAPRPVEWKRMSTNSCLAAASQPVPQQTSPCCN